MRRRLFAGFSIVLVYVLAAGVFVLSGCGKEVDITSLADKLLHEITYQDELNELDLETASMFLNFGDADITRAFIYESSGATAEELIVLECAAEADANKAGDSLKERVEEQKEAFADYVPQELEKLGTAVIVTKDRFAVLSVSDEPEKAKEIIKDEL